MTILRNSKLLRNKMLRHAQMLRNTLPCLLLLLSVIRILYKAGV